MIAKHSAVKEDAVGGRLLVKEICKSGMKKEYPANPSGLHVNFYLNTMTIPRHTDVIIISYVNINVKFNSVGVKFPI